MRTLLMLLALALAGGSAPATVHGATAQPGSGARTASLLAPDAPVLQASKSKKKNKNKKKKKDPLDVSIQEIPSIKKGKRDIEITVRVSGMKSDEDYTCELTIYFVDGTRNEADIEELDDGVCTPTIDIPDDYDVVGDANVEVIVTDRKGKKQGSSTRTFKIKSTRA